MDKKDYTQKINLINSLRSVSENQAKSIKSKIDSLPTDVKGTVDNFLKRSGEFVQYLDYIKDFSFGGEEGINSDLFPGIKTTLANIDPQELEQKSEAMKNYSRNITAYNKKADFLREQSYRTIKSLFKELVEFIESEEEIYETELDLLKDMDSPYDVGQIARNS